MSSDPRSIIRKVLITEKGTVMRETLRQYYFEVARDANKIEIKRAVEAVFHVKVDSVQTMQLQGKTKRQRRAALVSALSMRATENAVSVIEGIVVDGAPKTARVAGVLKKIGLDGKKTLLVVAQQNEAVWKSVRNLRDVRTTQAHQLNPYDLLHCEAVLLTSEALKRVQEVHVR